MAFEFLQLDDVTRDFMLDEMSRDVHIGDLSLSKRFTPEGKAAYPALLEAALRSESETELTAALAQSEYWLATELRDGVEIKVRGDANKLLAESEFSKFYARAICRRAMSHQSNVVQVYRARHSSRPRPGSQDIIGQQFPATTLLDDLRTNKLLGQALGVSDVGSGLNVMCICDRCTTALGSPHSR